ncbi:MAG: cytochrome c3 family protein [Planctomycetota bacterium]
MKLSPRPGTKRPVWSACGRAVALWLGAAALCLWCGCTVTKDNYAALSFFFDGVPDPSAVGAGVAKPGDTAMAAAVVVHQPFAQENCEACHKTKYRPSRNDPSSCLGCHKGIADKQVWTHGAVAGGACLWCHSPHESARKWLLRGPDRTICTQCHSATMMNGSKVPAHVDPAMGCVECHFGHGGENSLMLKPGATAQSPPRQPDTPPADKHDAPSDVGPPTPPPPNPPATSTPPPGGPR